MINVWAMLAAFMISSLFSLGCYSHYLRERSYIPKGKKTLYPPRLGVFVILCLSFIFLLISSSRDAEEMFSLFIVQTLMLTGCLGLLLLLLPALRKIMHAESCASLWVIICFVFALSGLSPRWSIPLPFSPPSKQLINTLFWIWLAGFATVMLWSILTHLFFRHRLLKNAKLVEDKTYQQIWARQLQIANLPDSLICLRISPDTQTPLSIGLLWRTTCLVLPEWAYSTEELALVFQHELIHISRRDSILKLTMTFWAAVMWFNPLAWIALRVCAEDLELSCDEAVLYGCPTQSCMEYAALLLHTAARQQGFTSCLSASAASLRYRLKNVVTPRKRIVGSVIIGFLCFSMLLGSMCMGIQYRAMPASELLFTESDVRQLEIVDVFSKIDGADVYHKCDRDQLLDFLGTLSLQQTTETPDVYAESRVTQIVVRSPECSYMLTFGGRYLRVVTITFSVPTNHPKRMKTVFYRLDSNLDWQLLLFGNTPG